MAKKKKSVSDLIQSGTKAGERKSTERNIKRLIGATKAGRVHPGVRVGEGKRKKK